MAEYHGAARAVGGCTVYVRCYFFHASACTFQTHALPLQFLYSLHLNFSDKPGNHDFDVLGKLVLPDGSTLRAKLPGRPTRDCLFSDPTRDGKRYGCKDLNMLKSLDFSIQDRLIYLLNYQLCGSLLKIWNMNDFNGVLGVFNCQGASWCRTSIKNLIHDQQPQTISSTVQPTDVEYLQSTAHSGWNGDCIMYSHRGGKYVILEK